ncbi:MAG: hypothetical protein HY040_24820 [Planctomycetes bacterium]|nr:hypothetical protein [Planctomycetota bacterium]
MRDSRDFSDLPTVPRPAFPWTVTLAGIVWFVLGGLFELIILLRIAFTAAVHGPSFAIILCGVLLAGMAAPFFIIIAVGYVRGTAKDTLGTGILSIVLGLLYGIVGSIGLQASTYSKGANQMIVPIFEFVLAGSFTAAGILALGSRRDYKAWRNAQQSGRAGQPGHLKGDAGQSR